MATHNPQLLTAVPMPKRDTSIIKDTDEKQAKRNPQCRKREVGFGSTHRPFMEQKSYFKSRLEIENKLDNARPLLKMMCKDKWRRLERK